MATWDVFHSDRLEVERALSTADVRAALVRGDLRDDDLVRPSGTTVPWARIGEMPALLEPEPQLSPETAPPKPSPAPERRGPAAGPSRQASAPETPPPVHKPPPKIDDEQEFDVAGGLDDLRAAVNAEQDEEAAAYVPDDPDEHDEESEEEPLSAIIVDDDEDDDDFRQRASADLGELDLDLDEEPGSGSQLAIPVLASDLQDEFDPIDEDEAAAEFTLSRSGPEKVEELDLAAMVDVAFQLVLFFLVTATTVLYKSLEVPKPNPDSTAPKGATQGKSLDDLKDDFILVEIDSGGAMKIDRENVAATMPAIIERLRTAREKTGRKAMLLSADYSTQHRNAVLAYDAANEIGLGIAIARPAAPSGSAPVSARATAPAKAASPAPSKPPSGGNAGGAPF